MAWQTGTSPASNSYREILTRLVAFATSQHVDSVVVNASGTGYTAGDLLSISHLGAYLPAVVEVLTLGGGGSVATYTLRSNGAFSNRVTSPAVNAGGTGYPVSTTIYLEIQGGTATEKAKVAATTNGSGVVTSVTLFETGGAYTVAPPLTAATTTIIGPSTALAGSGCTINLSMTGLTGLTNKTTTGGTGSGATFDITLAASGWTALSNRNGYSTNSINDHKEVVLQGTTGGDAPIIGFRTYTATSGASTRYGWVLVGMDNYNPALAFELQPNVGPNPDPTTNLAKCFHVFDNAQAYWFGVSGRRLLWDVRAVGASTTSYVFGYLGLLEPFGTQTESPYPLYVCGTSGAFNRLPDAGGFFISGPTEVFADVASLTGAAYRRASDGAWVNVSNGVNSTAQGTEVVWPLGGITQAVSSGTNEDYIAAVGRLSFDMSSGNGVSLASGGSASLLVMPTLGDDETLLYPATVQSSITGNNTNETLIRGGIEGVYWLSGTKADGSVVASEDTVTVAGQRYRIFANAHRTERYSFFAVKEA